MFKLFADFITYNLLGLQKGDHFAESLNFFVYDVPKIYLLLIFIVFIVAFIRSYLPISVIRDILSKKFKFAGNILAAVFGIFTPFCTCSAIPLFIGMLEAGIPLGVTMSFLIAAPTINEVALVMLWGLFGYKVALTYIASGLVIASVSGYIIGKLKMERYVESFVFGKNTQEAIDGKNNISKKLKYSYEYSKNVFLSIWLYVLIGVGIGALIHGYVPIDLVTQYAGKGNPFAVVFAVILGIPLYANCAGAIPVVQAILEKGLPLGTSLAFMMSVTGLSLPEFLILRKVLKPQLLLTFFGIVALGIMLIGYFFNLIF